MDKKTIMKLAFILLGTVGSCWAGCCTKTLDPSCRENVKPDPADTILKQLNQKTAELKSYRCRIEYLFSQPILESQTLRKGALYYQSSEGKSALRINFQTLKQDDEEEQKYIEHYIFDGVWLTIIDYQLETVKRYQLAEPNEPADAFELASENLPIVGFSKVEDLKKEFEIGLVEQKPSVIPAQAGIQDLIQLNLKVKPDSAYKDDYISIDFWIDKKLYLPAKVVAVSTEEDICEIKFLDARVNEKIAQQVFEFKIPKSFSVEITPLKKAADEHRFEK